MKYLQTVILRLEKGSVSYLNRKKLIMGGGIQLQPGSAGQINLVSFIVATASE